MSWDSSPVYYMGDKNTNPFIFDIQISKIDFSRLESHFKSGDIEGFNSAIDKLSLQEKRTHIWHYLCWLRYARFTKDACQKSINNTTGTALDQHVIRETLEKRI
jgi:hypothetical protein